MRNIGELNAIVNHPPAAIVGVHEHPRRRIPDLHPFEVQAQCIRAALGDAGLSLGEVDGLCTVATEPQEGVSLNPTLDLAEWLGVRPRWVESTDIGGCSFLLHAGNAAHAIAARRAEVVVISYASLPRSLPSPGAAMIDASTQGAGQYEIPYGLTLVGSYALLAQRHMHEYGTTREQLAAVAVTCRDHAALNPSARFRDPITVGEVLAARPIASPLGLLDCCVVTDGAGAIVVAGEAVATSTRKAPVWVAGFGLAVGPPRMGQRESFTETAGVKSGAQAFAEAGVRHDEIDVAQLYDAFTITPIVALEDLGFCERGDGGAWAEAGELALGGRLPTNTDGGGLSSNHPGKRGIFTVIEIVRQLRGEGPGAQVPDARLGLAHAIGGEAAASAATLILAR